MTNAVLNFVDRFLGRGEAAVTVPALDGALKPNNVLEQAPAGISVPEPDNLVHTRTKLLFTSGQQLLAKGAERQYEILRTFDWPITAMAVSKSSVVAIASGNTIQFIDAAHTDKPRAAVESADFVNITALAFDGESSVVVTIGSSKNSLDDWQTDLLNQERSGSLWRVDTKTGAVTPLAGKLAYPSGVVVEGNGNIIVSEAWQKRLVRFDGQGKVLEQVLEDLPGYPSRISASSSGGHWLSVFAPRSQLIEFVLREPKYRKAMMAEVDKDLWIAPSLRSGVSFREPMQGGALKQMGILKPWAPTRSYGLVIELSSGFVPLRSFHSRAGGKRHGITSTVEIGGTLWATSKGGHELIAVTLEREGI
jgi:hypothetical protein